MACVLMLACDGLVAPDAGPGPRDGGLDASRPDGGRSDAGPPRDAAARDGAMEDGGADGGGITGDDGGIAGDGGSDPDGGMGSDGGPPPAMECSPTTGLQCDGDWEGRCAGGCAATECCSPLGGRFGCRARAADGSCPAADIWVDTDRIAGRYTVEWRNFDSAGCEFAEGCVEAPGWRRLLKFDTWTPNTGTADLFLGRPGDSPELFEYSACHAHYHFDSYARYALYDMSGTVVARGHKQAFCLLDYYRYPGTDGRGAIYTCNNQGIQAGWQDVYGSHLDCQWVDVTGIPPGTYVLRIDINYEGVLLESDYTNNTAEVSIVIPGEDVTVPCPPATSGTGRSCGLTRQGVYSCTPGARIEVGCSATCGLGSCTDDPFIRVCEAADDPECTAANALGTNDDSGCGGGRCGRGGDCCPRATITCPPSGSIVAFYGPYNAGASATCDVAIRPAP